MYDLVGDEVWEDSFLVLRIFALLLLVFTQIPSANAEQKITIGYLEQIVPHPPTLSNLEGRPNDEGLAGAKVGLADNATTGKFLNHSYILKTAIVEEGGDFLGAARELLLESDYVLINAPANDVSKVVELSEAKTKLLFNVGAADQSLRNETCSSNLLHTLPSRNMLADALAQFSQKKRWTKWVVIHGVHAGDIAFLAALENAVKKFNIDLVAKKEWAFDADMRRNASQEVPLFTQDIPNYDLMVIADELGDFGRYVMYNTWIPRPVGGSEGIVPSGWSAAVEQHGAAQLQSRFKKANTRDMRSVDYAAWAAVRAVGEAVTRTNTADVATNRKYMMSENFQLAGFKGRPLTFRNWNGQMRQPIPLSHSRAVVASAPLDGFLHQRNELDTLGLDKSESTCAAFTE